MGVIAALLPNSTRLQRLRSAVHDRHLVVACDGWGDVTRACETQPVHLVVLDLYAGGSADFERVRTLKLRFPRVTLIAYVAVTIERARDMFDAGRAGVDGLVVADLDDAPPRLLGIVEQAEARSAAGILRGQLPELRPLVRDAVMVSVTRAHERLTAEALARRLALSRRALTAQLTESGFPPPSQLLTWGRLIVAAHLLDDRNRSADSVAFSLGFPSGSAFRNTCQRYLHSTPQQIRERGGAGYVISLFLKAGADDAPDWAEAGDAGTEDESDGETAEAGDDDAAGAEAAIAGPADAEPDPVGDDDRATAAAG